MECGAANFEALAETTVFLSYFKHLPDRRQLGKVVYPLEEILLLWLLAVLAGAESLVDIARFGEKKRDLLRRFLSGRHAVTRSPWRYFRHPRLGGVPALLCRLGRGADQDTGGGHRHRRQDAAPLLSEEGAERADPHGFGLRRAPRLVLGQVAVAEKSNEIVAIPALLGMMAIEGAVVTIDAMGCQRNIAKKIIARKADYILALKSNQGTLRETRFYITSLVLLRSRSDP